jgi:FG-GAP-like repeat
MRNSSPSKSLKIATMDGAFFRGRGKTDVVIRTVSEATFREAGLRLFTATADGMFSGPISFHPSVVDRAMTTADFNPDGLPDIFLLSIIGELTIVSTQSGGFNAPRGFLYSPPGQLFPQFSVRDLKSGDLNGDGALDLVVAASGLSDAAIMYGDGHGAFNAPVSINSGVTDGAPVAVEIRDFNNDGRPDLALLNSNTRDLVILNNAGQGIFTPAARISVGVNATGFVSADFNNDGNLDIVVRGESSGLALYLGDGGLGFTQRATGIGGNITNVFFTSGDFNGDGKRDLAIFDDLQSQTGNGVNIVILLGDGQGGFGQPSNVRIQERLIFLSAADLNLDGRDDLIYTHGFIGDRVFVILSNPEGGFGAPVAYLVGGGTRSVVSTDINGDGKLDLISSSFDKGTISLLLGDGDGGFNQQMSLPVFDSPSLIATGDFDQDGRIDLAIPRSGVSIIAIINNRSMCVPQSSVAPTSAASKFR